MLPADLSLARACDQPTDVLRRRLDEFYATVTTYGDFQRPSEHPAPWGHVCEEAARLLAANPGTPCRVLEFGAGRTGFGEFARARLGGGRERVHFTAQDVTAQNVEYLRAAADAVHVGAVQTLAGGPFDIIFSTFVFEHVTDPAAVLARCLELLAPGGSLFLFCPRYDVPGYLPPSAAHLGPAARARLAAQMVAARVRTRFTGEPAFLIHHDPAVFHLPFARDRDAIHWASRLDLGAFFHGRAELRDLPLPAGPGKDWVVKNLLTIRLRIRPRRS